MPSYEVYTIKWCLHDWHDEDALPLLRNVRAAIMRTDTSRLIILEAVLHRKGRSTRLARYGDINMMMTAKGRECTEGEWRWLAETAGWRLAEIHRFRNSWVCAIDLRLADGDH